MNDGEQRSVFVVHASACPKNNLKAALRTEAGSVLLMAVVLLAVVSIGAAAALRLYHITFRESTRAVKTEVARQLAEAGIENAVACLRIDPNYSGEDNTPLGGGRFSAAVTRQGRGYRLAATGEVVHEGRVLRAVSREAQLELAASGAVRRFTLEE